MLRIKVVSPRPGRTQQTQELAIGDFEVELAQLGTAEAR
jgi:hypothetical protein